MSGKLNVISIIIIRAIQIYMYGLDVLRQN